MVKKNRENFSVLLQFHVKLLCFLLKLNCNFQNYFLVSGFINCSTLSIGLWSSAWASFVPLLLRYCCAYLFYSNSIWAANLVRFVIVIQHLKGNFHNFHILNRKCEQQEHFCIMSCSSYCSVLRAQWVPAWCCAQRSIFSRVPKSIIRRGSSEARTEFLIGI